MDQRAATLLFLVAACWAGAGCSSRGTIAGGESGAAGAGTGASSGSSGNVGTNIGSDASAASGAVGSGSSAASSAGVSADASAGSMAGASCDPNAWIYLGNDPNACGGHLGESCGWTMTNLGQGFHCQMANFGPGCLAGGMTCPGGTGSSGAASSGSGSGSASGSGSGAASGSSSGTPSASGSTSGATSGSPTGNPGALVFSPYKDTSINMNWNTNVISTKVGGAMATFADDMVQVGAKTVTLAFATGECGSESWGGVAAAAMASTNVPLFTNAGILYVVSTGGAAGSFTCGSDAGMATFLGRWASSNLIGVDFDIEGGQNQAIIDSLISRVKTAHGNYPHLRFGFTLATLAPGMTGSTTAQSLGAAAPDSFNTYGDWVMSSIRSLLGFTGTAASWPLYVTINLMTMDYGSAGPGICVVSNGACQMGQSALQAAYNLHDKWGVPFSGIELTPMIGGNDTSAESFTPADADTVAQFAIARGLAGVHYWSYDRDVDCPPGSSSPTCNTIGMVGAHGYLKRFMAAGLK